MRMGQKNESAIAIRGLMDVTVSIIYFKSSVRKAFVSGFECRPEKPDACII